MVDDNDRISLPIGLPQRCTACGEGKPLIEFRKARLNKNGHTQPCKTCHAARVKRDHAANPEKIRARDRARRAADPEKFKIRIKKARAANPEKIRARDRARRAANPEKIRKQENARRAANREKFRARAREKYHANPESRLLSVHRRHASKRNLPNTFATDEYNFMFAYWNNCCATCGNTLGFFWTLSIDHVIPLNSTNCPGTTAMNLLPLCYGLNGCNNSKGSKDLHAWLISRFGKKQASIIEKAIVVYFAIVLERQSRAG